VCSSDLSGKVLPMEQCHSLLRECLHILEVSNDKDAHAFLGEIPDIPSD